MTLTIADHTISSDHSAHTARAVPGTRHLWEVSWLPGRHLDRNSAITAMILADITGHQDPGGGRQLWAQAHLEGWAAELGLTAPDALTRAGRPPGRADAEETAVPADPEAGG